MRISLLSVWLACTLTSTTSAFSASSKKQDLLKSASALRRTTGRFIDTTNQRRQKVIGTNSNTNNDNNNPIFQLGVASTEPISVVNMERGMGGRLEEAFENAKTRGEAAFVAFITAGYPAKEGMFLSIESCFKRRRKKKGNLALNKYKCNQ